MTAHGESSTPRQRRRAKRIEQLLDAAMDIALNEGLDKLTIAGVAKRVDAAVGALYRYFPGKGALVTAMQLRAVGSLCADAKHAFEAAEGVLGGRSTTEASLARAIFVTHVYLCDAELNPQRHRLIDAWVSDPDELLSDEDARAVDEALRPLFGLAVTHLRAAVDTGTLAEGDALQRTHMLWALVHGLDHLRKRDRLQPTELRVAALLDGALTTLLTGWGATANDAGRAVGLAREVRRQVLK